MSEYTKGRIEAARDAVGIIDLHLQSLLAAGIDEDVARAFLGLDAYSAVRDQVREIEEEPESFFGTFDERGVVIAVAKVNEWKVHDELPYAHHPRELLGLGASTLFGDGTLPEHPLGIKTLVAHEDTDQVAVLKDLLTLILEAQTPADKLKTMYISHYPGDVARIATEASGFVAANRESTVLNRRVKGGIISLQLGRTLLARHTHLTKNVGMMSSSMLGIDNSNA